MSASGECLFVCVVGPGFDLTSPTFVRSRACQEAASDARLAAFQPCTDWVFLVNAILLLHHKGMLLDSNIPSNCN